MKQRFNIAGYIIISSLASLFFLPSAEAQTPLGEKPPAFITSTLDGKRVALKEYWEKGDMKAIVLSFFATWCQPCKEDLKYLQQVQNQKGASGLQILCILTQDSAKADRVTKFLEDLGVSLPVLMDEYGIIGKRYTVTGLPCNFVIDKEGILRAKYLGYSPEVKRKFEATLQGLLAPR